MVERASMGGWMHSKRFSSRYIKPCYIYLCLLLLSILVLNLLLWCVVSQIVYDFLVCIIFKLSPSFWWAKDNRTLVANTLLWGNISFLNPLIFVQFYLNLYGMWIRDYALIASIMRNADSCAICLQTPYHLLPPEMSKWVPRPLDSANSWNRISFFHWLQCCRLINHWK